MKNHSSASWVVHVKKKLGKYGLPTPYTLIDNCPTSSAWKRQIKKAIEDHWLVELQTEAATKSTLRYLHIESCKFGRIHPIWRYTPYNRVAILQASVSVKLLVGRYHLQDDLNKFRKGTELCPLCRKESETAHHFLFDCMKLDVARQKYLPQLQTLAMRMSSEENWQIIEKSPTLLMQLILDPERSNLQLDPSEIYRIYNLSRLMLSELHTRRAAYLEQMSEGLDKGNQKLT